MVDTYTLVMGYRNREFIRVKRCLDSLKNQTKLNFRLVFVDYGSETKDIYDLVSQYDFCQYVYADTRGLPWSRAKALNIGIKLAKTEYTITSDIDMIFPPHFFDQVQELAQENMVVNARCYWLPKDFTDWENVFSYSAFPLSDEAGKGGFQLVATKHLHAIQGFDEYYQYYGAEDRDINHRLKSLGLGHAWFEERLYHQWHEIVSYNTANFMPEGVWDRVNIHFLEQRNTIVRNSAQWGEILTQDNRPVYKFVEPTSSTIIPSAHLHKWEKSPWSNEANSEFLQLFVDLPSEDAIFIHNYRQNSSQPLTQKLLRFLNRIVRLYDKGVIFDYKLNRLRMLIALIIENREWVKDYYLPPNGTYAILVRK